MKKINYIVFFIGFFLMGIVNVSARTIVEVDIQWGAFEYNYVQGWDNTKHDYTYTWQVKNENSNRINITNNSNFGVTANLNYSISETQQNITGTFKNASQEVITSLYLPAAPSSNSATLELFGTVDTESIQENTKTNIGEVIITLEAEQFEVTYDTNSGVLSEYLVIKKKTDNYGELPLPIKDGYTFEGWYLEEDFVTKINNNDDIENKKDHTLYANYIANNYEVTLDGGLGVLPGGTTNPFTVTYDVAYGELPTLDNITGYDFAGWYLEDTFTTEITNETIVNVDNNHTIYAKFEPVLVTVNFDLDYPDSVSVPSIERSYNESYGELPNPEIIGYAFEGWYLENTFITEITNSTIVNISSNHTIYAKLEPVLVTINFDLGHDEQASLPSIERSYNESYGELPTPERLLYIFEGWYLAEEAINSTSLVNTIENHTLKAKWTVKTRTLTIDPLNGEYSGRKEPTILTLEIGETITLEYPILKGYQFVGWTTQGRGSELVDNKFRMGFEDIVLAPMYLPSIYILNFEVGDATLPSDVPLIFAVEYNGTYGTLPIPEKEGHSFIGWYLEDTFTTEITSETIVNVDESHTLYAKFEPVQVTVNFDLDYPGSVNSPSIERSYDTTYRELPFPERAGYIFTGWYLGENLISSTTLVEITTEHTLMARWLGIEQTITVEPNGGEFRNATNYTELTMRTGESTIIENPTKEGYSFVNWTLSNSSATIVVDEDSISLTAGISDVTLTANWRSTLAQKILNNNTNVMTRTNFTDTYVESNNGNGIFSALGQDGKTTYYFAGAATNNYVKFGKANYTEYRGYQDSETKLTFKSYKTLAECEADPLYNQNCRLAVSPGDDFWWRIIRINEDKSVRLIYAGLSPNDDEGYTKTFQPYNDDIKDSMYGGYKYGTTGSQENNRLNTNDSLIKIAVDEWYNTNFNQIEHKDINGNTFDKSISRTAIYCNDRNLREGQTYSPTNTMTFASYVRLNSESGPTFVCDNIADSFSGNNPAALLEYPIALLTPDEYAYAGGMLSKENGDYYLAQNVKFNQQEPWYTLGITGFRSNTGNLMLSVFSNGKATYIKVTGASVRPVLSLKSCALDSKGDGTSTNPYEIEITTQCSTLNN